MNSFTIIPIAFLIGCGAWFYWCAAEGGARLGGRIGWALGGAILLVLVQELIPRMFPGIFRSFLARYSDQTVIVGVLVISAAVVFVLGLLLRWRMVRSRVGGH